MHSIYFASPSVSQYIQGVLGYPGSVAVSLEKLVIFEYIKVKKFIFYMKCFCSFGDELTHFLLKIKPNH